MRESDGQGNLPPDNSDFFWTDERFGWVCVFLKKIFPDPSEFLRPRDLLIFEAGKDFQGVLHFRPEVPRASQNLPSEEAAGSQAPISFVEKGGGLDMEKTHKKWGIKSIA